MLHTTIQIIAHIDLAGIQLERLRHGPDLRRRWHLPPLREVGPDITRNPRLPSADFPQAPACCAPARGAGSCRLRSASQSLDIVDGTCNLRRSRRPTFYASRCLRATFQCRDSRSRAIGPVARRVGRTRGSLNRRRDRPLWNPDGLPDRLTGPPALCLRPERTRRAAIRDQYKGCVQMA